MRFSERLPGRATMSDLEHIFERQAVWQRSRSKLPWAEKLCLSVVMRESLVGLRQSYSSNFEDSDDAAAGKRDSIEDR